MQVSVFDQEPYILPKEAVTAILKKRASMRTNNKNKKLHIPLHPIELIKEFWNYDINPITGTYPVINNFSSNTPEQTSYIPSHNSLNYV